MKKNSRFALFAVSLVLLALFTRVAGVNIDETNYNFYSFTNGMGDSRGSGKPPFFYQLNVILMNTFGWLLYPWRPLTLYIVYAVFNALAVVGLCRGLNTTHSRKWLALLLITVSPFFLFNTTTLMMETPILGLVAIVFGALVRMESERSLKFPKIALGSAVLAMLLKETAYPAILFLLVAYFPKLRRRMLPLALAVLAAIVFRFVTYKLMRIHLNPVYADAGNLTSANMFGYRFQFWQSYFLAWVFYLGPAAVVAALILSCEALLKKKKEFPWRLLTLAAFSAAGVAVILVSSNALFIRYTYPVVWVGILGLSVLLALHCPLKIGWALVLCAVLPIANMWFPRDNRFSLWPSAVSNESYNQGSIVMAGTPFFGWYLVRGWLKKPYCVWLPEKASQGAEWDEKFLRNFNRDLQVFSEGEEAEFANCKGAPLIVRRQYTRELADCGVPACESYSLTTCTHHRMHIWAEPNSSLTNWVCLP